MFKPMRKNKREISTEECHQILIKGEYGILSCTGENGYAYGVPLSYTYENNTIYFHCAGEGHKLNNLKFNNKVSFCVVGDTELIPEKFSTKYESVIVFGKATPCEGDEKISALMGLITKYSKGFEESGSKYIDKAAAVTTVYKITPNHVTGKASK